MKDNDLRDRQEPDLPPSSSENEDGWSEQGRRWYQELKEDEGSLAPWLHWEWTGEQMKARRD